MNKNKLRNLINFELKHNFGREFLTKKEIKETLNKLYKEGFIIIKNKVGIPVYIECEGYKMLSIINGNGLDQDLLDLEEGEGEYTICTIDYESGETQYGSGHGNVYHIPSCYRLDNKIEGKIKNVILGALQIY